jgi:hypothetical protein
MADPGDKLKRALVYILPSRPSSEQRRGDI